MSLDSERVTFLRHLTERHRRFLVWKHLDRALVGRGDVDAAAPSDDVDEIQVSARAIARTALSASHVIQCDHVADKHLQFFVQPHRLPQLFELDICTQPSRGLAPWAAPLHMLPLSTMSAEGIRRLRPGSEAVVSIVYQGISPTGRPRLGGDELGFVARSLARDMSGAEHACEVLPPRPARAPLADLVVLMSRQGWDGRLAQRAYLGFVAAGFAHPGFTARRGAFRLGLAAGRECVMSQLGRRRGRQVAPAELPALLTRAEAEGHVVLDV